MDEWIAEAIGKMHINKITQVELAQYMGYTRSYISSILIGRRKPPRQKSGSSAQSTRSSQSATTKYTASLLGGGRTKQAVKAR